MKIVTSYGVGFRDGYAAVKRTVEIYNCAIRFLINIVKKEWPNIENLEGKLRNNYIEKVVHSTVNNKAIYDFDERFYKFPSYLRRSAINSAIGHVSAYMTNKAKGEELSFNIRHEMPVFYNENMYKDGCIKVFRNNDWVWQPIRLNKSDKRYLDKKIAEAGDVKVSAPVLCKKKNYYELRYTLTYYKDLTQKPVADQVICAVDLGVNNDAVCSVLNSKGTVLARKFINLQAEKDHLNVMLKRKSLFQSLHGVHDIACMSGVVKRINLDYSHKIAHEIVKFARSQNCDVIVMEYLNIKKKHTARNASWRYRAIQKTTESLAHQNGIRFSRVNARNTSKLAYDGSGLVNRHKNQSVCTFKTGKIYNCDLSASYNIGARYFLRELELDIPVSQRTLSTLINYYR